MYSNKYNPIIIIITFNLLDKGIIEKVGYKWSWYCNCFGILNNITNKFKIHQIKCNDWF